MAPCRTAACSMCSKVPAMCGRMASRSKAPTRARALALAMETVKWLAQNQASRSAKGRWVTMAVARCERTSACTMGRKWSPNCCSPLRVSLAMGAAPAVIMGVPVLMEGVASSAMAPALGGRAASACTGRRWV